MRCVILQRLTTLGFALVAGITNNDFVAASTAALTRNPRFIASFPSTVRNTSATGRLIVCIATKDAVSDPFGNDQPRYLIGDSLTTQQAFAVDVWDFHPDSDTRQVNASHSVGYPVLSLIDVPAGEYWVQAVLQPYVYYNRSDGYKLWLPRMDTFEVSDGVLSGPGSLFSKPQLIKYTPTADFSLQVSLNYSEPELPPLDADSPSYDPKQLLRHVRFRSKMLSDFWGTDVYLKAWVLLPYKYFDASTANTKYPLFIYHTHFSTNLEFPFNPTPPTDPEDLWGTYGYYLYSNWTSGSPNSAFYKKRGIIVQLQHANPYYDDSYAVNSANIGPYGDAITHEFIPFIEAQFRTIGQGWARTMYGGSTGGWESLANQVFYPDEYNGCWALCPDSPDFRRFQLVDLINDDNAYYRKGVWTQITRSSSRDYLGNVLETMEQENHHERLLGSRGRSGGQWDVWQAVYSPVNTSDGYPAEIWDKLTGDINKDVVKYWEDNYDLRAKLEREWTAKGLGKKLVNKLHVYVGVADTYFLNGGVYLLEEFLQTTSAPHYNGTVEYGVQDGRGSEHCWTGSNTLSLTVAFLTVNQRIIPQMVDHIVRSAPSGASLGFTKY